MFSWKPIYEEVATKLLEYRDRQDELITWLHEMKSQGIPVVKLDDENPKDTSVPLTEIDPFSFFANFNRGIKMEHRIRCLEILKKKMTLSSPVPSDFDGIPVVNLQKAMFFPFAYDRKEHMVPALWDLATEIVKKKPAELSNDLFSRCLDIPQVGIAKLTMGMFWIRPDNYLALDQVNMSYLVDNGFAAKQFKRRDLAGYIAIVDAVSEKLGADFAAISHDAYTESSALTIDATELDSGFRSLLERTAKKSGTTLGALVHWLNEHKGDDGENEITTRVRRQKELGDLLRSDNMTLDALKLAIAKLWVMTGQQDSIRRNRYFGSGKTLEDIATLQDDDSGVPLMTRINDFIDAAQAHGYQPNSGEGKTEPAQFASVLLSAYYPDRFVDFRKGRWNRLYREILNNNQTILHGQNYGYLLLRAGSFAAQLSQTPTFRECFGSRPELWAAAGVAYLYKDGVFDIEGGMNNVKRYWAGGFLWGGKGGGGDSHLNEFIAGNYWQHGYSRDDSSSMAKQIWKRFDQITPGDEFAIKGYGGSGDLKIKYIGKVKKVDTKNAKVLFEALDRPLYEGKGPAGSGAGNWQQTLLEVNREDVIDMIFRRETTTTKLPALPSKNIILYGPPGTGKTYALRTQYMEHFTEHQAARSKDDFVDDIVADMAWWEVITLAMLDLTEAKVSTILDHPLVQARIRRSETRSPRAVVWSLLQTHTKQDCANVAYGKRYEPLLFTKSDRSVWSIDIELANEAVPELADRLKKYGEYKPSEGSTTHRYTFVTFHQSYAYEDFVEGIKPVMDETMAGELAYQIVPGVFRQIAQRARQDPGHEYAVFIDEINRGNVASIFGELITLLEDDKRMDQPNEITTVLPYSRGVFGVPSNLYVIGTMNTADRSVEALDTALRRRFSFIECEPDPSFLANHQPTGFTVDIAKLLTAINARIERLLDRDHCIGHSYFMGLKETPEPLSGLQQVFGNKVLPLLKEYFYGDPGKVGMVLGTAFVKEKSQELLFADGDWGDDILDERRVFAFVDPTTLGAEAFQAIYAQSNPDL